MGSEIIRPLKAFRRASASSTGEWLLGAIRVVILEYNFFPYYGVSCDDEFSFTALLYIV